MTSTSASPTPFQIGIDTFGDRTVDADGDLKHPAQVIRDVVDEGILADQVGLDSIGIGEHHRDDFAISAPDVVLAGIAGQTERITLGSAVTVLSSDDPVRVFQRFSTLDAVSGGRAEVILGRGSFTESFPLFGYDLNDYSTLFEEKLDLFRRLLDEGPVTWSGSTRPPLEGQVVWPPTESGALKTWVGVGGSPESVIRTARHGLPMMLAIIGGSPVRFAPFVELYHRALLELGQPVLPVGAHLPGHVAETDEQAMEELWPGFRTLHDRIGRERGWPPMSRADFAAQAGPDGSLVVGSPSTVAEKLIRIASDLQLSRIDIKVSAGPMAHEKIMTSIELLGREVAPIVRHELATRAESVTA